MKNKIFRFGCVIMVWVFFSGCSTYHTVTKFRPKSPKIYSGTRLNIHSIKGDEIRLKMYTEIYGVDAQKHPYLDLPFSLLFDTVLLPLTISVATNDIVFN